MKSKLVLLAVVCLVTTAAAQFPWGEEPPKPRWRVYALEGLGALGGAVGCYGLCVGPLYLASLTTSGSWEEELGFALFVAGPTMAVAAAALPAAAGYSTAKVGERLGENGSTGWAIGGAYAGTLVGLGIGALGHVASQSDAVRYPAYVLGGLAIPTGAVVGYNLGGRRGAGGYGPGFDGRLQPPGLALTGVKLPDHSVEYGVKVQLAGLRF